MLAYKESKLNGFNVYDLVDGVWAKISYDFEPAFIARLLVHRYLEMFPFEDKDLLKIKLLMLEKMPDSVKAEINKVNFDNLVSVDEFLIALGEDADTEILWNDVFSNHTIGNSEKYLVWVDEVRKSGLKLITEPSQVNHVFPSTLYLFCNCKIADLYLNNYIDLVEQCILRDKVETLMDETDDKKFNELKELAKKLLNGKIEVNEYE